MTEPPLPPGPRLPRRRHGRATIFRRFGIAFLLAVAGVLMIWCSVRPDTLPAPLRPLFLSDAETVETPGLAPPPKKASWHRLAPEERDAYVDAQTSWIFRVLFTILGAFGILVGAVFFRRGMRRLREQHGSRR